MDRLARKVAARWGLKVVTRGATASVPEWVVAWGDAWATKLAKARVAFSNGQQDEEIPFDLKRPDGDLFSDAKESMDIMLPKFQSMLRSAFGETYHATASRAGNRIYYFFSSGSALEAFAITLLVTRHHVDLVLGYVPYGLTTNRPDYANAVQVHERVLDPEMAGLSLMRLTRKLLAQV